MPQHRAMPPDFAINAPTMSRSALARYYVAGWRTIDRWAKESGASFIPGEVAHRMSLAPRGLTIPPDFTSLARLHNNHWLGAHYRVCRATVSRWRRATGIPAASVERRAGDTLPVVAAAPAKRMVPYNISSVSRLSRPTADGSLAGRAAQHLRTLYSPVYDRKKVLKREGWQVGARVMTAAEMIDLARAKGFQPDAWKQVAA